MCNVNGEMSVNDILFSRDNRCVCDFNSVTKQTAQNLSAFSFSLYSIASDVAVGVKVSFFCLCFLLVLT